MTEILERLAASEQQEVRWHVAQLLSRLDLDEEASARAVEVLTGDRGKIVKTFSMQALTKLALDDTRLRFRVTTLLRELVQDSSPAMRSRGRRLLAALNELA